MFDFTGRDVRCEHRKVEYQLRPRGGLWSSIYDADAMQVEVQKCALTGTECISKYKINCPRYNYAFLQKLIADKGG